MIITSKNRGGGTSDAKILNKTKYTKSLSKILKKSDTSNSHRHVRKKKNHDKDTIYTTSMVISSTQSRMHINSVSAARESATRWSL